MIHAELTDSNVLLRVDLEPGSIAYFDADWIPHSRSGAFTSLVADASEIRWDREAPIEIPPGMDARQIAMAALTIVATDTAEAVRAIPPERVEVAGIGFIARRVRDSLGLGVDTQTIRQDPEAIIDTTGNPALIVEATRRLGDMGTLVLASQPSAQIDLDLYPDVHVRGLNIVGIAPPLARGSLPPGLESGALPLPDLFEEPRAVVVDTPLPLGASWYCIRAAPESAATTG